MKLWFAFFILFLLLFATPALIWLKAESARRRARLVQAIRAGVAPGAGTATPVILFQQVPESGQSGAAAAHGDWSRQRLLRLAAVCGVAGLVVGFALVSRFGAAAPLLGAALGAFLPAVYQRRKQRKRLSAIEAQFPEALDCLSRSIRAGNAFSVAIELLADETPDPLRSEIQRLTRELALGSSLEDGLNGLIARVPLLEVRFFASAVLLQRETGGNLGEVISKLAGSIRERFKLRGQVRASSGQGRLTAMVLGFMPIAVIAGLHFVSPDYLNVLTSDPLGRKLLVAAGFSEVIGFLVMKQIIKIEV